MYILSLDGTESEFEDEKIQVDLESRRSVEQFKDDHAFEEFKDESKFNDDQVAPESRRLVEQFKDDHAFEEFEVENGFDQVRKLRLIFIYYKSEVAGRFGLEICLTDLQLQEVSGRSGQEIGTDLHLLQVRGRRPNRSGIGTDLHLLHVRGFRPIGSGNSDKTNSQKRLLRFPSYTKPSL